MILMKQLLTIPLVLFPLTALGGGPGMDELKGHTALVYSVAFSPDGKILATGSFDGTVKLWDFASRKELRTLKGHTASIYAVAWKSDGKLLASASQDKTIRLWNPADGKTLTELKGHGDIVDGVAFSPDGKLLASCSVDKTVRLWNPADGKEIKNLGSHKESAYGLAFSPNGQLLASCGNDGVIKLWDVKAQKELREIGPRSTMATPAAPPAAKDKKDKKDTKAPKKVEMKTSTPKEVREPINAVVFSLDSTRLLAAGRDRFLYVWNVADGAEVKKLGPAPDDLFGLALSRDGKKAATAGYGGSLRVWDWTAGKLLFSHDWQYTITYCVTFTPDGQALVTGQEKDFAARVTPIKMTR
jgi:WD40 repeat protein